MRPLSMCEAPDQKIRRALRPALHLILRSRSSEVPLNYVYLTIE